MKDPRKHATQIPLVPPRMLCKMCTCPPPLEQNAERNPAYLSLVGTIVIASCSFRKLCFWGTYAKIRISQLHVWYISKYS